MDISFWHLLRWICFQASWACECVCVLPYYHLRLTSLFMFSITLLCLKLSFNYYSDLYNNNNFILKGLIVYIIKGFCRFAAQIKVVFKSIKSSHLVHRPVYLVKQHALTTTIIRWFISYRFCHKYILAVTFCTMCSKRTLIIWCPI